jgi:hypothetical protein
MRRVLLRAGGAVVLAAVLVGPSAQARAPHTPDQHARPAYGHTTNEFLMRGAHCGASMTAG